MSRRDAKNAKDMRVFKMVNEDKAMMWVTPFPMFEMGMFVCCYCCKALSIDNKYCGVCNMESIALVNENKKTKKVNVVK